MKDIPVHILSVKIARIVRRDGAKIVLDLGDKNITLEPRQVSLEYDMRNRQVCSDPDEFSDTIYLIHSKSVRSGAWTAKSFPLIKVDFNHWGIVPERDNVLLRVFESDYKGLVGYPAYGLVDSDDLILWLLNEGTGVKPEWLLDLP